MLNEVYKRMISWSSFFFIHFLLPIKLTKRAILLSTTMEWNANTMNRKVALQKFELKRTKFCHCTFEVENESCQLNAPIVDISNAICDKRKWFNQKIPPIKQITILHGMGSSISKTYKNSWNGCIVHNYLMCIVE